MRVDGDEETLVELEGTWKLLRELPHTLQELVHDGGHLFRISIQVGIPAEGEELLLTLPSTSLEVLRNQPAGRERTLNPVLSK